MEKLLMVLVICVSMKAVENWHHPKFVRAFEENELSKTGQPAFVKLPCNTTMDKERYSLTKEAECGAPRKVFFKFYHIPRASYEEIYPGAVWINRCIGRCENEGTDSKCLPKDTVKRQIPVKRLDINTAKESCSLITIEEHVSCQCMQCSLSPESCQRERKVFNPRTCTCRCQNLEERLDCHSKNMRWDNSKCTCEA